MAVIGPLIVDDLELVLRAVLDGIGLAFMAEHEVAPYLADGTLVRVLQDWCQPFPGFFMYYPSRRQRPGTAHGFIFISLEDETGIANAVVDPDLYEANRNLVTYAKFLLVEGTLQNIDKVIHLRAKHIEELSVTTAPMESHDFH